MRQPPVDPEKSRISTLQRCGCMTTIRRGIMDRPITTLFMLMSLDGKISPGASDELDVDKDFPRIDGLKEGLPQYYEIEQTTDIG